ncbi:hypothetical protein B4064_0688 [Caldibacillus thermoamylovorans]|nr:hypothetical protein B4064_0688 [Caldibacillus thermoamylovorans]
MLPIQLDSTIKNRTFYWNILLPDPRSREGEKRRQGDNGIEKAIRLSYG